MHTRRPCTWALGRALQEPGLKLWAWLGALNRGTSLLWGWGAGRRRGWPPVGLPGVGSLGPSADSAEVRTCPHSSSRSMGAGHNLSLASFPPGCGTARWPHKVAGEPSV